MLALVWANMSWYYVSVHPLVARWLELSYEEKTSVDLELQQVLKTAKVVRRGKLPRCAESSLNELWVSCHVG